MCSARVVPRIVQLPCDAAADDAECPLLPGTLEVSNSAANLVHGNAHVIPEHDRRQARHQTAEFSRLDQAGQSSWRAALGLLLRRVARLPTPEATSVAISINGGDSRVAVERDERLTGGLDALREATICSTIPWTSKIRRFDPEVRKTACGYEEIAHDVLRRGVG